MALNFNAEVADIDFDTVRKEAYAKWNKEISKIRIEGASAVQETQV